MKYKVGDRVKIKSLDWYNKHTLIDTSDVFRTSVESLCLNKKLFMGKELTICSVLSNGHYLMKETGALRWTDEMIEGLVEEEKVSNVNSITQDRVDKLACKIDEELPSGNPYEWECPEGYIFKDENGNVINATKIVLEKKNEYPKTYEECYKVLGYGDIEAYCIFHTLADERLFEALYRLKVCRDAYWKLYGEEMGLGKPWEPDWKDGTQKKYGIYNNSGDIQKGDWHFARAILAFPTAEMRDAFYENFKSEIEICKELL